MANYYRKNSNGRSRSGARQQEGPRWFWMLFGSLIGGASVFLVLGFYTGLLSFAQIKSYIHAKTATTEKVAVKTTVAQVKKTPGSQHEQRVTKEAQEYEFYSLLTQQDTNINTNTSKNHTDLPSKTENSNGGASRSAAQAHYIIQTGIFQELNEADSLKARLTLQGFNTRIQKVQAQDGQIFFRVTLGPFASEAQAKKEKKRLEQNKIRGILILQRQ